MLHAMHNDPIMIGRGIDSKNHFRILCSIVLAWGGKRPWRRVPPLASSWSFSTGAWAGKRPWRSAPLSHHLNFFSTIRRILQLLLPPPAWARGAESTSDSDPKWSPYLLAPRRSPWRTQSGLPNPSLWKRARAPPVRSPLLSGFLLLFLILDDAHLAQIHPWISSLSRLTGCASNPTPFSAPPLVVWLGLTTSWRRTTERKLRGLWGGCDGAFHLFHQVLGWSSCLRSPTNRHAVVRLGRIVSPDFLLHFSCF